jgi:type IV secretory pathway TraG/TraD family ATPase VirD4
VIHHLYRRFATTSGRHVFLVIDEAARLTNRLRFEELLSVARRARVSVVLATQDVGQFADATERVAILGNCATYVSLPSRSATNAEYFLSRLGQRYQSTTSLSHTPGRIEGRLSRSSEIRTVGVLGQREVLDPPWGERAAIVHVQPISGKPFLVDLTRAEFL